MFLDLAGTSPEPEEVDSFAKDPSHRRLHEVGRGLLSSPRYGERMAIGWLDVVRYADTIGYHSDNPRNVWPYRDYVIRASTKTSRSTSSPANSLQATCSQAAPSRQKIGSAFNRLLLTTEEGGRSRRIMKRAC